MNLQSIGERILEVENNQKTIESKIDQILAKLGSHTPNNDQKLESIAAKIISDLTKEMKECHCNKEIVDILNKEKSMVPATKDKEEESKSTKFGKPQYTFPNFDVGNEGMGSSKNPNALTWPFEKPSTWPPK
ncbi:DNA binding protein [Silene caulimovirus A]|nr:DNA binding protein [Silene caulimovirus A]